MSWRVVFVSDASSMKLKLDNLFIEKDEDVYSIPLCDISMVVVDGFNTTISTRLLNSFASHNISCIVCDNSRNPSGVYHSIGGHSRASKLLLKQIEWTQYQKDYVWQIITKAKLKNQYTLLEQLQKVDIEKSLMLIKECFEKVEIGDSTNREGHGAKIYWSKIFYDGFKREKDSLELINSGLNYGYAILRAYISRLCIGYGLVCSLGVHHKSEYNQFNLVDDLIEPFRPFIDYIVYKRIMGSKYFTKEHREELINVVNGTIIYSSKKMYLSTAIEKYVYTFISLMNDGDISGFEMPLIENFIIAGDDDEV